MNSAETTIEKYLSTPEDRQSWADFCRVIATFGVIVIHACGQILYSFGKTPLLDWTLTNAADSVVRCAVPLFAMLSGALLLKSPDHVPSPSVLGKRVIKIIVPLIFWSIFFLGYVSHYTSQKFDPSQMLKQPSMYHLWFVYMIIGLYILLPALQILYSGLLKRKDLQIYLLAVWFMAVSLPVFLPLNLIKLLYLENLLGYGGYFLMGAIIRISSHKTNRKIWILLFLVGVSATFLITQILSQQAETVIETAYLYFSPTVFLSSVSAFKLITTIRLKSNWAKVFGWVSDRTFIIFFIHVIVLERIQIGLATERFHIIFPTPINILIAASTTFIVCLAIAAILRIIPKSRVILG